MDNSEFANVTVHTKANVYFEGRVISHTIILPGGDRKTIGVILPGSYHFGTKLAEKMEIVQGEAEVVLDGSERSSVHKAGEDSFSFNVPADSGFTISVNGDACHYICSFVL